MRFAVLRLVGEVLDWLIEVRLTTHTRVSLSKPWGLDESGLVTGEVFVD